MRTVLVAVATTALAIHAGTASSQDCSPFTTTPVFAGSVPTPQSVLGFPLGSNEVTTAQSDAYLAAVDSASARVVTGSAAVSVQGRPLRYAIVGSERNLTPKGLDQIRKAVQQLADPNTSTNTAAQLAASTPAILWLAGNVHGNEESGADASLRVLYELADRTDCVASRIRDTAIVVILPIQNPDGREADTRRNAYGFDMNRDWFARTQPETDGKLELLRQYPPTLFIDAHEFSFQNYFFPPNADPVYHEVPERPFAWINQLYAPAIEAEMDRQKIQYFHGAPYDLYAAEYGDTVPTIGFHSAGMTFEKYNGAAIDVRAYEHYVAMMTSLFTAANSKQSLLEGWHASFAAAAAQGAAGTLEPNAITYDGKTLLHQVPNLRVRHYFLLNDPGRPLELARIVRRLQRMDVQVFQLNQPLQLSDFTPYGGTANGQRAVRAILPAGTYWIPMAQRQKHWIQAMLHEDPYVPITTSYDVTAWSNPLLMNLDGGSSGDASLAPSGTLVPPLAAPAPPVLPANLPRIGLFEMPGSTTAFASAGSIRYLFERVWNVPYQNVTADMIAAGLSGIDVLLVPDGYVNDGLQALGTQGRKALATWVANGGRYVGYVGGTELAARTGVSTVVLQNSRTTAPGTLIRIKLDPTSPLAAGIARSVFPYPNPMPGATAWVMYDDNDVMSPGLGAVAASFPATSDPAFFTSGLAQNVGELGNSAAIVDERLGAGRAILFSFDPNFRAWADGTQRLLWNALFGPSPAAAAAVASAATRADALDRADRSAKNLAGLGKAIRIVVRDVDADATRTLLQRYGAEFKELKRQDQTIFLLENRRGLSWEEHPFILQLHRELLAMVQPMSFSVP